MPPTAQAATTTCLLGGTTRAAEDVPADPSAGHGLVVDGQQSLFCPTQGPKDGARSTRTTAAVVSSAAIAAMYPAMGHVVWEGLPVDSVRRPGSLRSVGAGSRIEPPVRG